MSGFVHTAVIIMVICLFGACLAMCFLFGHTHWHVIVRDAGYGNKYVQCRCGNRRIIHQVRNHPMDYRWLKTGEFSCNE